MVSSSRAGRWPLIISATLFTIFVATLLAGKASTLFEDGPRLHLGDVPEFLLLFASVIAFVVCVLYREAVEEDSST